LLPLLLLLLGAPGCGSDEPQSDSRAEPVGPEAADPEAILRFGAMRGASYDPIRATINCELTQLHAIFDTLLSLDPEGNPAPGLAERFEQLSPERVRLQLRPGIRFQDGTPLDAEAVRFSLERVRSDPASNIAPTLWQLERVEVAGELTLDLVMSVPAPGPLLASLAGRAGMIVSPAAVRAAGSSEAFSAAPVGAGMYRVVGEWFPRERMSVRSWEGYWDPQARLLGGIDFVEITPDARVNALRSGSVDMLAIESVTVPVIERDSSLRYKVDLSDVYRLLVLNETLPPFNDLRVRRAVAHAIDRDALTQAMTHGLGRATWQPFPPGHIAYDPGLDGVPGFDPERARQLLADSGYPDGVAFDAIIGATATSYVQVGEILQAQLRKVGLEMRLALNDVSASLPALYREGPGGTGAVPASPLAGGSDPDPDKVFRDRFLRGGMLNAGGNEPEGLRDLIERAAAAIDPRERAALYRQATRMTVEQSLDGVPLYFEPGITAYRSHVGGVRRGQSDCRTLFRHVFITRGRVPARDS
jgi:ABC-type transport system substrate-binding protein